VKPAKVIEGKEEKKHLKKNL